MLVVIDKQMGGFCTQVSYDHTLCSGGTKNASSRALRPEATKFFHSNRNMTASSLKKLSGRSASHLCKDILGTGDKEVATSYTILESFLEFLGYKSREEIITDCQVRGCTSRENAGSQCWAWMRLG